MKILLVNKYFFIKGGAENSFFVKAELLKKYGHEVVFFSMKDPRNFPSNYANYFVSNVNYDKGGLGYNLNIALKLLYSFEAKGNINHLINNTRPDLIHLNNIYHQLSPSILHTIKKHGLPMVMSLRDYKMVCASYSMSIGGKICEACKEGKYFHCFFKSCVKRSHSKSLLSTIEMYLHHRILNIYRLVDVFISPSRFLKDKVAEMGFKGRVVHIPNFVFMEDFIPSYTSEDRVICYFGRLAETKGIEALISAVKELDVELRIIGEGPYRPTLEAYVQRNKIRNVVFTGYMPGTLLQEEIRRSLFTVIPSEWYENNPRSVIESFALGKPVVGAHIGGIPELVRDGETGFTFNAFSTSDLRTKIVRLLKDPALVEQMGRNARRFVEIELNANLHYKRLMEVYRSIMK